MSDPTIIEVIVPAGPAAVEINMPSNPVIEARVPGAQGPAGGKGDPGDQGPPGPVGSIEDGYILDGGNF